MFVPVVTSDTREPAWFAMRYRLDVEPALRRVLDMVGQEYALLIFEHRVKRKLATRHWFPGYIFLRVDLFRDRWQQLLRAPGVIELLGLPSVIPDDVFYDVVARCPSSLANNHALTVIPVGSEVEVLAGAFEGHRGVVSDSHKRSVFVELMMFGRPTRAELLTKDVKILRHG